MALKKTQEREYAKVLYLSENISQKDLAARVGVTEKTLSGWIEQGGWKNLKRSLLTTRQNQLNMLYDQLDFLNTEISKRDNKAATSKEGNTIIQLANAIKKLEIQTSVGETIEVARAFIGYVGSSDIELAKKVTVFFDLFIQTKMK
ncbi:helix-turn-helix domain-containing protein [Mucilaginibacter glaciei]|uniref:DDE transposase family protein n=1 Tax=Mucilaginibacter glaciei TaxID=2772109 RepID=A0A926S2L3_9SPHI|nr:DDE transposase family protein [Mucilaginibacter glaciei]MBD1394268.1 DDE transposase family protein [Mucilaginibacter glaciei]